MTSTSNNTLSSIYVGERVLFCFCLEFPGAFIDSPQALENAESNPLWSQLPAVKNGQLCTTENLTPWILTGPAAAEIVTSDLEACFDA
ncbi:hypothetical protein [Corynebacterium glutamicum]|uniref:hypothetical protein n=1 Tax=Corynebacterium glutamicum TaxID=1718 RepID=UPI001F519935|nr:hypothetical protein [Corynebacterium glutamicum]